jgi:site-specific recombinase XerD
MAFLFRPKHNVPLPPDAEIVNHQGQPHIRLVENGRKVLYPLTKDRKRYRKPLKKWYGQYTDGHGKTLRVPLSTNKTAAQQLLAELVQQTERTRAGLSDPCQAARSKPLAEHLADWETSLRANGRVEDYIQLKVERVKRVLKACEFRLIADFNSQKVESYLSGLRQSHSERPEIPVHIAEFTLEEAAAILGIQPQALSAWVRRHHLKATGQGKARRFPLATVQEVSDSRPRGLSLQTINHILDAVKAFSKWLAENNHIERNPFLRLKKANVELDVRHRRGELTEPEIAMMLEAIQKSGREYRGLSANDRVMLYEVALGTGFRRSELAALTCRNVVLTGEVPTIRLGAKSTKNRQRVTQPISHNLAEKLRRFLQGKKPDELLWPGTWCERSSEMVKRDLLIAGVEYVIQTPDGEEYRDFHSFRATYISNVIRSGATIKEAMTLARHSDPKLTAGRYARIQMNDLQRVVNPPQPHATSKAKYALKHALAGGTGCEKVGIHESCCEEHPDSSNHPDSPENRAFAGCCNGLKACDSIAPGANRTHDPQFRKPVLYPLSYEGGLV